VIANKKLDAVNVKNNRGADGRSGPPVFQPRGSRNPRRLAEDPGGFSQKPQGDKKFRPCHNGLVQ
jgi:hypothetical protein